MTSVSIGIPFYNAGSTLPDAIRSIFAQTFQDWELILVDDGSTDHSLAIAKAVEDPRVTVVSDGNNKGLPARLNQITRLAKGKYLARMDSDDLMHPDRIQQQVDFLSENTHVSIVGTAICSINSKNVLQGTRSTAPVKTDPLYVLKHGLFAHPTIMGHIEWFRSNHYDERFLRTQDHELWCRTYNHSTFAQITIPLHFYRENSVNSVSYLKSQAMNRKIYQLYGPKMASYPQVAKLMFRSYLKSLVVMSFSKTSYWSNVAARMIAHRNNPIESTQYTVLEQAITTILNTRVPGF